MKLVTRAFLIIGVNQQIINMKKILSILPIVIIGWVNILAAQETAECVPPHNVSTYNITATSFGLKWNPVTNASQYLISIFDTTIENYQALSTTGDTSIYITGLTIGSSYSLSIQTICANGDTSSSAFITIATSDNDTCQYTIEMTDTYGDGWNSATLSLFTDDDENVATFSWNYDYWGDLDGYKTSRSFSCAGRMVRLLWKRGVYDGECGFVIKDAAGFPIITGIGGWYPEGTDWTNASMISFNIYDVYGQLIHNALIEYNTYGWESLPAIEIFSMPFPCLADSNAINHVYYTPSDHGTIWATSGAMTLFNGQMVGDSATIFIHATPSEGYAFDSLTIVMGNDTSTVTTIPYALIVTDDVSIKAYYHRLPTPDLQAAWLSTPDSVVIAQPFIVKWILYNSGTADISDRYVSDKIFFNGTEIGVFNGQLSLSAGDSVERQVYVTIPCESDATGSLLIETDVFSSVYETEETNNLSTTNEIIVSQPNLSVVALTPTNDSVITHGDIVLSWTVVSNALGYHVYMWKDGQDCPSTPTYSTNKAYYIVTNYSNSTTYNWRVVSYSACDSSISETLSFTINKTPVLTLNTHTLNFGEVNIDSTSSNSFFVSGVDLTDSVRFQIEGSDASSFEVSPLATGRHGGTINVNFTPTITKPDYSAHVIVQSGLLTDTVFLVGKLANYYVFTVSVPDTILPANEPVAISGTLSNAAHIPLGNIPVDVYVMVMGQTFVETVITDASGHFEITHTPKFSECGFYQIGACLHNDSKRKILTHFNIPGVSLGTTQLIWEVIQNDTLQGEIQVSNRCNITLHNVSMTATLLPDGLNVEFDTLTLSPFQTVNFHYTLVGESITEGAQYLDALFSFSCNEGFLTTINAYYYCHKPIADLQVSFDTIECAVEPGTQKIVDVALYNNTDSTFHNVQLLVPSGQSTFFPLRSDSTYEIAPHDSLFVPLLLMLPSETPLVPITSEVAVSADEAQIQNIPLIINVVSQAKGSLRVLVSNEYTYYNNGPYVEGAHISVVGYYSLDTVAQGITGNNGEMLFNSLPEGYYKLTVEAPENDKYEKIIQIKAGQQNFQDIILSFQAITYSWVAYQKDIDDSWGIIVRTEYKTNVPKPVITIDAPPIDVPYDGSMGSFNLLITNHGLIDAYDAKINLPSTSSFEFFPLFDKIDTIHALSSIVVPCGVRDKIIHDEIESIKRRGGYTTDTIYSVSPRNETKVNYVDTLVYIPTSSYMSDTAGVLEWIYDTAIVSVPRHITYTVYDSAITHIIYYDALTHDVLLDIDMYPETDDTGDNSPKNIRRETDRKGSTECELIVCIVLSNYRCADVYKPVYSQQTIEIGRARFKCNFIGEIDDWNLSDWTDWTIKWPWKWKPTIPDIRIPRIKLPDFKLPHIPTLNLEDIECEPCLPRLGKRAAKCADPVDLVLSKLIPYYGWYSTAKCILGVLDGIRYCIFEAPKNDHSEKSIGIENSTESFEHNLRIFFQYHDSVQSNWYRMVNDSLPVFESNPEILAQIIGYLEETDSATVQGLAHCYDTSVTIIDTTILRHYADRWNRTLLYRMRGWSDPSLVPEGFSLDFYYPNSATISVISSLEDSLKHEGYETMAFFLNSTIKNIEAFSGKKSTCASVSLQFKQEFAMTREAFEGILSVHNPHESSALENLKAIFTVSDINGNDCSDKFDISVINYSGIDTTDGKNNIASNSSGNITVRFVPLMSAAPTDSTPYLFGGNIQYINPYTNTLVSDPLSPVQLMVTPSPHLCLDYFIPHDIISDDPLTSPVIEAMVPATIGLRVLNDGYGEAKNIRVSSIQPEITENRLGLAVEFHMLNTMRNGTGSSQPLSDISLGNLTHKESQTLEYYLASSLLGTLTVKDINVIHNSSINDRDMSLVDAKAHRLVKTILQYGNGADQIHDFLTTSITQPDSIFFSNGGASQVHLADSLFFDHFVEPGDTVVQVTMNPDSAGWSYGTTDDPGQGKYEILSCVRDDNVEIPLDNIWLTFVDLPTDLDPVYVNKMHLVDTLSAKRTVTYNVTFQKMKEALEVDTVICESSNISVTPLDSVLVRFNKAIVDSTFTHADMSLKCNNGANLMDNTVEVHRIDDSTFSVLLAHKNIQSGFYVLKVMADSVVDADGRWGVGGKQTQWMRLNDDPSGDTVIYVKLGVVGDSIFSKEEQSMVVTHPEVTHVKLGFRVEPTAERIELYDADENLIGTFDDSAEPSMIYRLTTGTYIVRAIFFNGDTFQQTLNFENVIHY